jgi:hypothetical protein
MIMNTQLINQRQFTIILFFLGASVDFNLIDSLILVLFEHVNNRIFLFSDESVLN